MEPADVTPAADPAEPRPRSRLRRVLRSMGSILEWFLPSPFPGP